VSTLSRLSFVPLLVGGALLLVFLFSLSSIEAPKGMAAVPTNIPANYVAIKKSVNNPNPAPGTTVTFTVQITLGSTRNNVSVVDALSGPGISATSDYVAGTARLDGNPLAPTDVVGSNPNPNRRQNVFTLGTLTGGPSSVHTLIYEWNIAPTVACNTYLSNGATLRSGTSNLASDTLAMQTKCGTTTSTTVPCNTTLVSTTTTATTQVVTTTSTFFTTTTTVVGLAPSDAPTTTPPPPTTRSSASVVACTSTTTAIKTNSSTTTVSTTLTTTASKTLGECSAFDDRWFEPEQKIASAIGAATGQVAVGLLC